MSKKDNVISLEERRRKSPPGKRSGKSKEKAAAVPENTAEISGAETPVPGRLIWLHCPTCDTLEYTEMAIAGGRKHNLCGSHVVEKEVELDLRAEHTIAQINLERLNLLENLLVDQRRKFEEYQHRLSLAAGKPLTGYALSEKVLEKLPIAKVDAFGLLISTFFHQVEGFAASGEKPPNGSGTPAGSQPPAGETAAPSSTKDTKDTEIAVPTPTDD